MIAIFLTSAPYNLRHLKVWSSTRPGSFKINYRRVWYSINGATLSTNKLPRLSSSPLVRLASASSNYYWLGLSARKIVAFIKYYWRYKEPISVYDTYFIQNTRFKQIVYQIYPWHNIYAFIVLLNTMLKLAQIIWG